MFHLPERSLAAAVVAFVASLTAPLFLRLGFGLGPSAGLGLACGGLTYVALVLRASISNALREREQRRSE